MILVWHHIEGFFSSPPPSFQSSCISTVQHVGAFPVSLADVTGPAQMLSLLTGGTGVV